MLKGILENLSFYILILMALFAVISMLLARSLMSKLAAKEESDVLAVEQTPDLESSVVEAKLKAKQEDKSKPAGIEDYVYLKAKKEPGVGGKS